MAKKKKGAEAVRERVGSAEIVKFPGGGGEVNDLDLAEKERNDLGNADRLLARHGQDFLYVRDVGWHRWADTHWTQEGAEEDLHQRCHETARSILEEVVALQKRGRQGRDEAAFNKLLEDLLKWSYTSGNKNKLDAMMAVARPYVTVGPEMMDRDPYVLNFKNGTIKLEGYCEDLRDHDRDDLLAKVMDVEFDPDAEAPAFHAFMEQVQPDAEIRDFLMVWFGYLLTGITTEQKLVFNYGEGGNGKSVLIDLICKMMGPYAASLPFSSLLRDDRKRGAEATPDLARLPGARTVRASEPEKGARFAEAHIKALTGGEEITVRHLNQGFFDFTPQFKLILSGNHKPQIRGQDRGIWRRLLLVPWEVNIPEEDQDLDLSAKLWAERSGVLNWMLDGARIWLKHGLKVPDKIRAATDDYRNDSDPLGRFMSACVEVHDGEGVGGAEMYAAYEKWCKANAERPWSQTMFGRTLPERGIEKSARGGRVTYLDVRLVNVPESREDPPPVSSEDDYSGDG